MAPPLRSGAAMPSIDSALSAAAVLPSPVPAATDRTLCEYWDPSADRSWRIVSLAQGGYAFELDVEDFTLVHESYLSLADAVARAKGWWQRSSSRDQSCAARWPDALVTESVD
jgi:hypothetical protein